VKLTRAIIAGALISSGLQAAEIVAKIKNPESKSLKSLGFEIKEPLIPSLGIYLLVDSEKNAEISLKKAQLSPDIESASANEKMQLRSLTPNDTSWKEQWGPKIIQAPLAWAMGTGGENSDRDEIVVAVVDNGTEVKHSDLTENIWVNTAEIPGNGIDDDGNGYVDDVHGWNGYNNSGSIPNGMHGTHVSGIVGAKGNNGKGIAGVNWNVKIMPVAASSGDIAVVLKGYNYILEQKKSWLSSGGKSGANVVVTNSSFGIDGARCSDSRYKLWNDVYEAMGKVGILSAAATANQAWNIDNTGDVPTSCESEYVIAVTNTTSDDKLFRQAGWGKTHVDIGAPGTDVISTVPGGNLSKLTGTSMATPHIAGAVALMHSLASAEFVALTKSDPALAALQIKNMLLLTVDPLSDLKDKTVSGGRLNLKKAVESISTF
jgi:subtilisin family serine protease